MILYLRAFQELSAGGWELSLSNGMKLLSWTLFIVSICQHGSSFHVSKQTFTGTFQKSQHCCRTRSCLSLPAQHTQRGYREPTCQEKGELVLREMISL